MGNLVGDSIGDSIGEVVLTVAVGSLVTRLGVGA